MLSFLSAFSVSLPEYINQGNTLLIKGSGKITREGVKTAFPSFDFQVLNIEGELNEIDNLTFANCSKLLTATINAPIKTIGYGAFMKCFSLGSIAIPPTCERLEDKAFYKNTKLETVTYTNATYFFGYACFDFCENLVNFTLVEGAAVEAKPAHIGPYAFADCKNLTNINLPVMLVNISLHAFYECSGIETIVIPDTVTNIETRAFFLCDHLMSIALPGVVELGNSAFGSCFDLLSVKLGDNIQKLGDYAFKECRTLGDINLPGSIKYIGKGCFESTGEIDSIVIPNTIVMINEKTFQNSGVISVTLPDSVAYIEQYAFTSSALTNLVISPTNNIKVIGQCAFMHCINLAQIRFNQNLEEIGKAAFQDTSIATFYIPENLNSITPRAFAQCGLLTKFEIDEKNANFAVGTDGALYDKEKTVLMAYPTGADKAEPAFEETCTEFADCALEGAKNLQKIAIPEKVTRVGAYCFALSSIKSIKFTAQFSFLPNFVCYMCEELVEVIIPEGIVSINNGAFMGCSKLQTIRLPKTLSLINQDVFKDCISLTEINLENVMDLESNVFEGCTSLEKVVISNVNKLFFNVFKGCSKLSDVTLPDNMIYIFSQCFAECTSLQSIVLPKKLEKLSERAFYLCTSLQSITIPPYCRHIQSHCFESCTALKEITFEGIIDSIEEYAFRECTELAKISFKNDVNAISGDAFRDIVLEKLKKVYYCGVKPVYGSFFDEYQYTGLEVFVGDYYKDLKFGSISVKESTTCVLPTPYPTETYKPDQQDKKTLEGWQFALIATGVVIVLIIVVSIVVVCAMKAGGWKRRETLTDSLITQTV